MTKRENRKVHKIVPPAQLSGIITEIFFTMSGAQEGTIDLHEAGTDSARLVLRWGKLHMTFTSAKQVQHLRGYFAMAKQGLLRGTPFATLPVNDTVDSAASMLVVVTWVKTPGGSASIEQLRIPRFNKVINYVALRVGEVTFRILDTSALDSANELLARAHQLAETAFPDGQTYRANPTVPSWHPNKEAQFTRRGPHWIPRS